MKQIALWRHIIYTTIIILVFAGCQKTPPPRTELILGTVCSINLFNKGSEQRYNTLFERLNDIDRLMSATREDSTISAINNAAGIHPVHASEDILTVLRTALLFAEKSDGLFDPTIGPLVALWDIGGDNPTVPDTQAIEAARSLVDWRKVTINQEERTVFLQERGMRLDLGAIAKGWAADELARQIRSWGIPRAMIDLGGNIFALGNKDSKTPWHIGIRNPEKTGNGSVLSLFVSDSSMVTSGLYERYFIEDGKRFHHILDPGSGYPGTSDVLSVSILAENSMEADALSTILFLMGIEKGLRFIEDFPEAEAVFVDSDLKVYTSSGLRGRITIRNERFSLADD